MKKKLVALLMMTALIISGLAGTVKVQAAKYLTVTEGGQVKYTGLPGEKIHVKIPVSALYGSIYITSIIAQPSEGAPFITSDVKLMKGESEDQYNTIDNNTYAPVNLEFDVTMKDTATIGTYSADIKVTGTAFDRNYEQVSLVEETLLSIKVYVPVEKTPIQLSVANVNYSEDAVAIGENFSLGLTLKNEGEIAAYNAYMSIDFAESGMVPGYSVSEKKLGDLISGASKDITLPVDVLSTATDGLKKIIVNMTCKDSDGTEKKFSRDVYIKIKKSAEVSPDRPSLVLSSKDNNKSVDAGTDVNLSVKVNNAGGAKADSIKLAVTAGADVTSGIIKGYSEDAISVKAIEGKKSQTVKIPLIIDKAAAKGLKELTITATYKEADGTERTASTKLYLSVNAIEEEGEVKDLITISNVKQSPEHPFAGSRVTLIFNVNNQGNQEIKNFKIAGDALSSDGFEPVNSEPYQTVGNIKAGKSKTVTMNFMVGEKIPEGLNPLTLAYNYLDAKDALKEAKVQVYILNVSNPTEEEITSSKPKLIISDSSTDVDELRAGSTFNFTFVLRNTHASKAAKNIKVTISQADGIFSASKGSNSFYIDKIAPGEDVESKIEMKVKADAATNAYDLAIKMEYEYDEMSDIDKENGGVTQEDKIKLQAIENSRPVLQNVQMNAYDEITVDSTIDMYFEFINMGKSTLNNIYFTLEGDFKFANATMQYYGNLTAGSSDSGDYQIMPLVTGEAKGQLIMHFEDSNGDEVTTSTEVTSFVSEAPAFNPGEDVGPEPNFPVNGGDVTEPVSDIIPLWLFIVIQAAILIIALPVTYKIVVSRKKKKLRAIIEQEDAE